MSIKRSNRLQELERREFELARKQRDFPPRVTPMSRRDRASIKLPAQSALLRLRADGVERFIGVGFEAFAGVQGAVVNGLPDRDGVSVSAGYQQTKFGDGDFVVYRARPLGGHLFLPRATNDGRLLRTNKRFVLAFAQNKSIVAAYDIVWEGKAATALEESFKYGDESHEFWLSESPGPVLFWNRMAELTSIQIDPFPKYFGPPERLQCGWFEFVERLLKFVMPELQNFSAQLSELLKRENFHDRNAERFGRDLMSRDFHKWLPQFLESTDHKIHGAGLCRFLTGCEHTLVNKLGFERLKETPDAFALMAGHNLVSALLASPSLTDTGRMYPGYNNSTRMIEVLRLDEAELDRNADKDAGKFWKNATGDLLCDPQLFVDGKRHPVSAEELETISVEAEDPDASHAAARTVMEEAEAFQKWTAPPGAFVDIRLSPFIGVEVWQTNVEIHFVWWTEEARFWVTSINWFGRSVIPFQSDDIARESRVEAAIELIMASIIRDFVVVEERQRVFTLSRERMPRTKHAVQEPRVVYLPRIRYIGHRLTLEHLMCLGPAIGFPSPIPARTGDGAGYSV